MVHIDGSKSTDADSTVGAAPALADVSIVRDEFGFTVRAVWSSVDRPEGAGIVATSQKLANRLAAAMRAGVAVRSTDVGRDVNGKTFVVESFAVRARALNADLRGLGF